jgi:hypothetical protein
MIGKNDRIFTIGERVELIPETLAWKAEIYLRRKIGKVIDVRFDGRISIRFDNGRLLMGRTIDSFRLAS